MGPLTELAIVVHAFAASCVILIAPVNIIRRRKDRRHKLLGRTWVVCMYLTCVSGMFIYTLSGAFTIFHALAIYTFMTTTLGVVQIRRHRVRSHVFCMVGGYLGALTAGTFAVVVPGRVLPTLAVESPVLLWSCVAGVVVLSTAWVVFVLVRFKKPQLASSVGSLADARRSSVVATE